MQSTTSGNTTSGEFTEESVCPSETHEGMLQRLHGRADAAVERLRPQLDRVSTYAREEGTQVLLTVAAGVALVGVGLLLARAERSPARIRSHSLGTMRETAHGLADRAHTIASGTSAIARRLQKRAARAAHNVGESAADAWQHWWQHSAPAVDRIRPHADTVAAYAKEDPVRTALGIATAGALIFGVWAIGTISRQH